jgi:hypothetical protein
VAVGFTSSLLCTQPARPSKPPAAATQDSIANALANARVCACCTQLRTKAPLSEQLVPPTAMIDPGMQEHILSTKHAGL